MTFQKIDPTDDRSSQDPKMLLIYGYEGEELDSLTQALDTLNKEYTLVDSDQTGLTLEELLLGGPVHREPISVPSQRTMVISGYSQKELHEFLQVLKTIEIKRPIIATVTPTSKKWPFGNLVKELMMEHAQMSKRKK